jgi:oligoribonuclease
MKQRSSHLVWIDCEMTGLNIEVDTILEIASIITDNSLNIVAEGPSLVIYTPQEKLDAMDEWNTHHHGNSGLKAEAASSIISTEEAERMTLQFVQQFCAQHEAPLCGNSIYTDRIYLKKYMPTLEHYLNYRVIDVSSVKEVVKRWYPTNPYSFFKKPETHRALADIRASVDELKYYRDHFFLPLATTKAE